jgi:hypothetical protein
LGRRAAALALREAQKGEMEKLSISPFCLLWLFFRFTMSNDLEIKLLKETILALREELEKVRFEEQDHIGQATAGANEENRQLRTSVVELRNELERREAEHDDNVRNRELQHNREKADLHKTIAALRQKLEQLNESLEKTGTSAQAAANTPR